MRKKLQQQQKKTKKKKKKKQKKKTNTDNNKQLYGFVYTPRDACDECKSQDAQAMVEMVWQLGYKWFYKSSRGARHNDCFRGTAIQAKLPIISVTRLYLE